jgi:Fe-Mn family superoxide dismutase
MELHYSKHHAGYVANLNTALEKQAAAEAAGDVAAMVALQPAIRFNGGGHINHSIFWTNLAPAGKGGGGQPSGALGSALQARWGSFDGFKKDFAAKAMAVQGSGWAWLAYDPSAKGLHIVTCANQDPCAATGSVPIFGLDVWEHAYYLSYKNVRASYVDAVWSIANWANAQERFAQATKA